MAKLNLLNKIFNTVPLILLYYLSISEVDTKLQKIFTIFSFNLPIGNYVRNKSVNTTIASDWFTFLIALLFSNLIFYLLINNFTDLTFSNSNIGYDTFFTLFLFPIFWILFNVYEISFMGNKDA